MVIVGSIFTNNVAGNEGGAVIIRSNTNLTHSIIYNNKDKDGYAIVNRSTGDVDLSNNWWGCNDPNFDKLVNINITDDFNWIIMSFTSNNDLVQYKTSTLNINFNQVKNKLGVVSNINSSEELPIFKVTLSYYGDVNVDEGIKLLTKTIPLITSISAKMNDQSILLKIAPINKRIIDNKNVVVDYNGKTTYKVRVVGTNGKIVGANVVVTMKIAGKTYYVKTDKNGYAYKSFSLTPGKYTISVSYKGYTTKNTITVNKVLFAKSITKKKSKKISYSATLKTSKGKPIVGKTITFKIKGKTYAAKTNKYGVATVGFKNLKVGKYSVTVSYLNSNVKTTLKVR